MEQNIISPSHNFNASFVTNGLSDIVNPNLPPTNTNIISKDISLDQIQEKVHDTQKVDFISGEGTDSWIKQPTSEAKDLPPLNNPTSGPSFGTGDMGKDLNYLESAPMKTVQDFETEAAMIIDGVDWILSGGMKALAQDNTNAYAWELKDAQKKKLAYYLSLVLYKHQSKLKIEYVFFGLLIMAYAIPVGRAIGMFKARRKRLKQEAKNKEIAAQQEAEIKAQRAKMHRDAVDTPVYQETVRQQNQAAGIPQPMPPIVNRAPVANPTPPAIKPIVQAQHKINHDGTVSLQNNQSKPSEYKPSYVTPPLVPMKEEIKEVRNEFYTPTEIVTADQLNSVKKRKRGRPSKL